MRVFMTDDGPVALKDAFWLDGGYDGSEWAEWETGYSISREEDPLDANAAANPWTVWHGDGRGNGDFVSQHPTLDDALELVRSMTDSVDPIRGSDARFTRHRKAGAR